MATIRITDLALRTVIGTHSWERECLQDVIVNVRMDYDADKASRSDRIEDAVDYKAITKKIIALVEHSQFFLIEKLCAQILDIVMGEDRVQEASVRVDKPHALRFARSVSLEVHRCRTQSS